MTRPDWEGGWEQRGDGYYVKTLPRGDALIWHPSMGGDRHSNHIHLSSSQASEAWASYKPLRTWLKENGLA